MNNEINTNADTNANTNANTNATEVGFHADCERCRWVAADWGVFGSPQDWCAEHNYGA